MISDATLENEMSKSIADLRKRLLDLITELKKKRAFPQFPAFDFEHENRKTRLEEPGDEAAVGTSSFTYEQATQVWQSHIDGLIGLAEEHLQMLDDQEAAAGRS